MSKCSLIEWFEHLLFGSDSPTSWSRKPPTALYKLILRLQAEGVHWQDEIRRGGLTMSRYHLTGDIDKLMDYLDRPSDALLPTFKTRSVTSFFNHLLAFLARPRSDPVLEQDQVILEKIIAGESGNFRYASASFWGELARGWISRRRPIPDSLGLVPQAVDKTARLYDTTCTARGDMMDPMSMVMLPASEAVNPEHWRSADTLKAFKTRFPEHPLSKTVDNLVLEAVLDVLEGRYPPALIQKSKTLSNFLQNVNCIDENIRRVSLMQLPPLVIDVLQRLLALNQLDELWVTTTTTPSDRPPQFPKTAVMMLTEQLILAERQNKVLMRHISE